MSENGLFKWKHHSIATKDGQEDIMLPIVPLFKRLLFLLITLLWIGITLQSLFNLKKRSDRNKALVIANDEERASLPDRFREQKQLEKEIKKLETQLEVYTPSTAYLVVNTRSNNFRLYKKRLLFREGKCSTGSYVLLKKDEQEKWVFKTPKGVFRIQGKKKAPVWVKPDWAFVEEGLPVPPVNHPSRYQHGVLGDYSLSLGNGYLLHGTLYKRLLGMPVTHGCIRLNDEDLEVIYQTLPFGAKVFIF